MCTKFGQNPLKDVDSREFTRMLRKDGRMDGSITISLRNFVGEGIINIKLIVNGYSIQHNMLCSAII